VKKKVKRKEELDQHPLFFSSLFVVIVGVWEIERVVDPAVVCTTMTVWRTVKAAWGTFTATTRDTFGCTGNHGDAIDDDDDNNFVADNNGKGSSSQQPAFVEVDLLRSDLNHKRKYPDNSIRTAKYTLVSGLPLSLLYQFYKISNFYFLLVMIITLVPGASPINPFSSVVPLCVVLGAGIIKDLWEDWKRRKADQQANEMIVHVLRVPLQSGKTSCKAHKVAATEVYKDGAMTASSTTNTTNTNMTATMMKACSGHTDSVDSLHAGDAAPSRHSRRSGTNPFMTSGSDGRKRVVRFRVPAVKSKLGTSAHTPDEDSSPHRDPDMASFNRVSQTSAAVPPAPLHSEYNSDREVATPPAPARSALLKSQTHTKKDPRSPAAAEEEGERRAGEVSSAASTATAAREPKVTFQPIRSCDVYPGDIMLFRLGEEVKADCVILNTSLPDGLTYIETANLDGETNAKTRRAKIQTVEALGTVEDIVERALGVPASNAAAVYAKMNGVDLANGAVDFPAAAPPSKITVDSCGAVGAHMKSTPAQEADKAVAAVVNAQSAAAASSEHGTSARRNSALMQSKNDEEMRLLLGAVASSTSDTMGSPTDRVDAKSWRAAAEKRDFFVPASTQNGRGAGEMKKRDVDGVRDGEDERAFVAPRLEREEQEAVADHHRSLPEPAQPAAQQQSSAAYSHPRTTSPLMMDGADACMPSASEPVFALGRVSSNGTSGDAALERVWHQRHLTLDERLMEEGVIPVPRHVRELSAQYDRAVHSRTSSAGVHAASRLRQGETSATDVTESICVGDENSAQRRRILGAAAADATAASHHNTSNLRTQPSGYSGTASRTQTRRTPSAGDCSRAASSACPTVRSADGATPVEHNIPNDESTDVLQTTQIASSSSSSGVVLVSCAPTPDLSTWYGQLRMPTGEMVPLGIDQFIPRGCLIRNTDWVLGAVVYTGRHTKMLLNLRPKPNKITNMTRRLNQLNVFLFLLNQSMMFILCGLSIWSKHYLLRQLPGSKTAFAAWYIQWSLTRYSDATLFWWRYLTNFVLLSYLIPMSLYVTLEFNKAMQMLMIGADKRMAVYDEFTGEIKKARPKTSELNCQLGHVRYIFTDKTGTLTENLMTYVGGVVDGHTHNETEEPGGIGRALLRRRGSGGGGNNNTSNNNLNASATVSGADTVHPFLSMNGVDDVHYGYGGANRILPEGSATRETQLPPSRMQPASTTPADGGEAPYATAASAAAQPNASTSLSGNAVYQIPAALASPKAPSTGMTSGIPPPLTGSMLMQQRSSAALPLSNRAPATTAAAHQHTSSVDSLVRFVDQAACNNTSLPAFNTPGSPPCNDHVRAGSGVGLLGARPSVPLHTVASGSGYQWGSGTFGGFGSYGGGGASPHVNNNGSGGGNGGLRSVHEAVLERDPLFRYLRALALCHSIVCFPVNRPQSAASESGEADAQPRGTDDVAAAAAAAHEAGNAETPLTKAKRRAARKARKAARAHESGEQGTAEHGGSPQPHHRHHHHKHRSREEKKGDAKKQPRSEKPHRKHFDSSRDDDHHHHHKEQDGSHTHLTAGTEGASAAPTMAYTHSRHGSAAGLPPVSSVLSLANLSSGNFVEIPFAVPAGPTRDDFEPYTNNSAANTAAAGGDHEPVTAANSAVFAVRVAHLRSASSTSLTAISQQQQQQLATPHRHHSDGGVPQLSPANMAKLHGRTSSASWYQNRYFTHVMHSRNFSHNSNLVTSSCAPGGGTKAAAGGGVPSPNMSGMNTRLHRNSVSASVAEGANGVSAGQVLGGLEQFIDRSKIYEGQSLDEIALVNAARENGFSLFERTAKQMYVKALGRVMCYDIIAELEFTPQRKLMSILLQRRPDLDSEGAASSAAAGTSSHYHRKTEEELTAEQQAAAEAAASQACAAHCPFTPEMAAPAATSTRDVERTMDSGVYLMGGERPASSLFIPAADASHPATARRFPAAAAGGGSGGLTPGQPSLGPQSFGRVHAAAAAAATAAALQNVRSGSACTSSPPPWPLGELAGGHPAINSAGAFTVDSHKYLLLVKGADSSMMEIVNMQKKSNARAKEKMLSELDAMAKLGLRTLVLGQRYLSEEEVLRWLPIFNKAQCAMHDRNEKLHQAYALLEKDVDIVGTTAVEDKLQDEVPQTLEFCIQASIVVWMLTGDKRETAVTIAHTSGLVSQDYADCVCHLDVSDIVEEETLLKQQKQYEERARAKKANAAGESTNSSSGDEDDDVDNVSVSPSPTSGKPSNSQNNNNNSINKSIEVSSVTQPLPDLSCGTRSTVPQTARTAAGDVDGVAHKCDPTLPVEGAAEEEVGGLGTATTATSAGRQTGGSFLERKVARIEAQLTAAEEKCAEGEEVFGTHTVVVVVDGKTLDFIFQDNSRARRFFLLGSRCRSAVCCRMTPLQKAKIVRMFKRNMNAVALAIGDGANDVSMIQESSIGVGIMGLEGSQAELASDYAIPKFRFLKRLLFVHGRFSVFREAHCIVYSLYKNVIVTVGMIAYQFYTCYSGQSLMDSWLLAMFSIFFCSLQPLMIGILDKDVEDELAESLPKLYPPLSREFMYFSFPYIAKWLIDGVVEGLIFFFVLMYTVGVQDNLYPHMTPAIEDYGTTFFTMLVLVADFRVGALVTYYMILFVLAVSLEIIFLPIIEIVYSAMNNLAGSNWCVKTANELYGTSGKFWMMLFFACGVLVVITMASNMYIQLFYPWQNAGFAMRAARQSSHRVPYKRMKRELKAEYAQLLARYEALLQQQQLQQGEETQLHEGDGGGGDGGAATVGAVKKIEKKTHSPGDDAAAATTTKSSA
jgi:magnesium-transporting ATPase (P-type)